MVTELSELARRLRLMEPEELAPFYGACCMVLESAANEHFADDLMGALNELLDREDDYARRLLEKLASSRFDDGREFAGSSIDSMYAIDPPSGFALASLLLKDESPLVRCATIEAVAAIIEDRTFVYEATDSQKAALARLVPGRDPKANPRKSVAM